MLIEFRVENFRSLRDETVLTMDVGLPSDEADHRARTVLPHQTQILPVAAIYGKNASGKSNVLSALSFMRDAVFESHRSWSPDEGLSRDQFAWGPKKSEPSFFEVTVVIDSIRYQYGFVATDERFTEEWLFAWPNNKRQVWFERDKDAFTFGNQLNNDSKLTRLLENVTRPNSLLLSAAAQNNFSKFVPLFRWFRTVQPINVARRRFPFPRGMFGESEVARLLEAAESDATQPKLFPDDIAPSTMVDRFRSMLQRADFGIVDIKMHKSDPSDSGPRARFPRFSLKHRSECDDAWLPLEEESQGTRTLFRMALPILRAIETGGVLIIDELESSLHPVLALHIVREFNDPVSNPRNAQLIFTTHDTNLLGTTLGEPSLRRDQVWITEKDNEGGTVLYPLTDYKPRKSENVERGYLQGRYGGIPFLGNFSISGE